jgi:hypothetical protein
MQNLQHVALDYPELSLVTTATQKSTLVQQWDSLKPTGIKACQLLRNNAT